AKNMRKAPQAIAKDIEKAIDRSGFDRVVADGPYVNFVVDRKAFAEQTLKEVEEKGSLYGRHDQTGKVAVIEFPAPNTNKPLHLGHVRNMLLGQSTARILEAAGWTVKRVNLNNDRGIHICKSMVAYQKWGKQAMPDKKSDHFVGDFYVRFAQESKSDPTLEEEAREMLRKWEAGDEEVLSLWRRMNTWALDGFQKTYERFGISFDRQYYESRFWTEGKQIILDALEKGTFRRTPDGAVEAVLAPGLPDKILLRSDGTSVYMTQDIYLAKLKHDDFEYDWSIYVVGSEQDLHFQQLFRILDMLGFAKVRGCFHLSYGLIDLPSGRMKSREGTVVDADDFLDEVVLLSEQEVEKRHALAKEEIKARADTIGKGAIFFYILKYDPVKSFTYDPKESLSFEGETGPYIQYAYARIRSIQRKATRTSQAVDYSLLSSDQERVLVMMLARYPEVVRDAARNLRASTVARFALELAQAFNEYYHATPVIQDDAALQQARLSLIDAVAAVLQSALGLLGIACVEEM
ncbi:MAG: arginine--tRNA ligase, partial [Nanoarchaeota archaeon]